MREFSTAEMSRLSGLSVRQLDYHARTGVLKPSIRQAWGSGSGRRYSEGDLDRARMIVFLLDVGVSLSRIRRDGDPFRTAQELADVLAEKVLGIPRPVAV